MQTVLDIMFLNFKNFKMGSDGDRVEQRVQTFCENCLNVLISICNIDKKQEMIVVNIP